MKKELKQKEVLAMYDVRGIQDYIFRSNDLQEIIGASNLVEDIIITGLQQVIISNKEWDKREFLTDWENDKGTEFLENIDIKMQVLFIGGGNAYVLFRNGDLCSQMNKKMAKYVLDETYSLNLAVAVVMKTDNYKDDYEKINIEMRRIKARMSETKPAGSLPFMATDSITGFPLSVYKGRKMMKYEDGIEYLCTESWLKRKHFPKEENAEKILDNMVTGKGDNSTLALIHIDGNNMGKRLKEIMEDKEDYSQAVVTMRNISKNIKYGFRECFKVCEEYVDRVSDQIRQDRQGRLIRKIILAGDDITFICNAQAAIGAVEAFLKETCEHTLFWEDQKNTTENENYKKYGLSACAGITYFNSHFPFSDAYRVAESCCLNAKKRAKETENREAGVKDGNMGCFFDYQMCGNIRAENLEEYRRVHYRLADRKDCMIRRPYYVNCSRLDSIGDLNERNAAYDSTILWSNILYFKTEKNIPGSQAKKLRNSYAMGMREVDRYITFLESRQRRLPEYDRYYWYDALEIADITLGKEKK
ncbi:MAG: hypothetical protein HFG93_08345 [Dorea sp.]|nr:hypothetical protein [Dorea sp.]